MADCDSPACLDVYIIMYNSLMKKTYSVGMARANLPAILDDVQAGRVIQVTRRGQPVAVIMSPAEYGNMAPRRASFGDACAEFRARFAVSGLGVDKTFFRKLRDRRPGRKLSL